MTRYAFALLFLLYLLSAGSIIYARNPGNLIPNSGFENGIKGWIVEGNPDIRIDKQIKHNGKRSLCLSPSLGSATDLIKVSYGVPAKVGETYRARFYVYAGPLSDGSEPYGALEFYNRTERIGIVHTDFQINRYEPYTWIRLEATGIAPSETSSVRISMIMHPHASVRFDDAELAMIHPAPLPETDTVTLKLDRSKVISDRWRGFGYQGEIFLYLQRSIQQGIDYNDRRLIINRIKAMKPKYIRLTVRLSDWEGELGKQTPDNDAIKDLKSTIAIYKEVGADVQLTEWGHALPTWCKPDGRLPDPGMRRAFTDSWSALLKYLRNDCGLTNIRYVTMHNEPNGLPWQDYRAICRSLDLSLKAAGIRKDIQIIGPDEANENLLLPLAIRDLGNILDCYDAHCYTADAGSDLGLWTESRTDLIGETESKRKQFFITEFGMADGMDTWQTPHNDEYRYGLFLADSAISACNSGVSAMAMYCISDYDCGNVMKWGLWKMKNENWEPRPGFYSWSLLTRYTELGSSIHPLVSNASSVAATAFRAPHNGVWTLMAVNRSGKERPLVISGLPGDSKWESFVYNEKTVPTSDKEMINAGIAIKAVNGIIKTSIPSNAFVLWHEIK